MAPGKKMLFKVGRPLADELDQIVTEDATTLRDLPLLSRTIQFLPSIA